MTADRPLHLYEQVLLLSLRSDRGTSTTGFEHIAIASAVLAEWLIEGRISVDESRKQLVSLNNIRPGGDPVLDQCLEVLKAAREKAPLRKWIGRLSGIPRLRHSAATQLCARGILRADEDKVLWLFPRKIYPEVSPKTKRMMLERIRSALDSGSPKPDERMVVLISLAHGTGLLAHVFGRAVINEHKDRLAALIATNTVGRATQQFIATYGALAAGG